MSKVEVDTIDTTSSGSGTLTIGSSNSTTITTAKTVTGNFKDIQWQSVVTADGSTNTTAEAGKGYFIDTSSAAHTINLPASPSVGDTVAIADYAGTFGTNSVTVGRNSSNIQGVATNATINTAQRATTFVYADSTKGWIPVNDNTTEDYGALFTEATGGTETTSGNFKIHTFTSSGCFVVSQVGNSAGSPSEVSYLVVAGGGGGAITGGGGAGGYREGKSPVAGTYTASPLAATSGITVTAQTYPITVGAGGAGQVDGQPYTSKAKGSNSVFSTITSAGGGYGIGNHAPGPNPQGCGPGGSGGGANSADYQLSAGNGNTPPVSPSQGNNGGAATGGSGSEWIGGGGGGASAAGGTAGPASGAGGTGTPTEITGTAVSYAGGGGGGAYQRTYGGASTCGTGGQGGGHSPSDRSATAGTTNRGGGGGGQGLTGAGTGQPAGAGDGGSGLVVIRYKYQ